MHVVLMDESLSISSKKKKKLVGNFPTIGDYGRNYLVTVCLLNNVNVIESMLITNILLVCTCLLVVIIFHTLFTKNFP